MNIEIFQIAALKAMESMWAEGILDTQDDYSGDRDRITCMYKKIGWTGYLQDYGVPPGTYVEYNEQKDHWMKWCGVGIAVAYLDATKFMPHPHKVLLLPEIAKYVLPSTYRIQSDDHWRKVSLKRGTFVPQFAQVEPKNMRPGDIVTTGNKRYGSHFRMCARPPSLLTKKWRSVEANGVGELPDGSTGEGVVRNTVRLEQVKRVYRPTTAHVVPWPYAHG